MRLLSPRRLSSSTHRPSPSPTISVPLPPSLSVLLPVPPSFACAWLPEEGFRLPLLRHHLPPLVVAHTPTFCTGKLSHLLQEVVLDATTTGSQYVNSILRGCRLNEEMKNIDGHAAIRLSTPLNFSELILYLIPETKLNPLGLLAFTDMGLESLFV
ncbi:hypothetical protein SESBI_11659 [Sesbania bispinosa]|nr:hypothetical protein SESBI_11659 [Sesbania bispinosa]